ncbi:MAG: ATP-binding protein [Bacteroidetes bacterium]|nr:ATP-binding protein [Bacteroidota bacterium]
MLKETLKTIVLSQHEWISPLENEIARENLNWFSSLPPFAYIVTGVRRSGKSTLLRQVMRKHGSKNYFNFEDTRVVGFEMNDFLVLEEVFSEIHGNDTLFFFDEIQNVPEWERYVRIATERKKTVVITGSNATMLSFELGTKLTGRHLDCEVFPFSWNEFILYFKLPGSADDFSMYLTKGGFPEYLEKGKEEIFSTLISDILIRDIFSRYNLRNHDTFKKIVQYLLSNTCKETSFNNLKNTFEIGSANTVMDFMNYLLDAYLFFLVPRFDYSLKVQARNPRKIYAIDQGLVNFSSVSGSPDHGRLLENAVFLHLRRNGKEIWYFNGRKECDFIIRKEKNKFLPIQVTWQLGSQNEKRETEGLLEAMNQLNCSEGLIITFDQEDQIRKENKTIRLIPGWKWMK